MTRAELRAFLDGHRLGVLSTIGPSGTPQSALVGIAVAQDLELVFDTVKSSRKYPNLLRQGCCAFVVGLAGERTAQYEGIAEELTGDALAYYQRIYFEALPDGPARLSWEGIVYFVVKPRWIRFSDYGQSPPLIEEFVFD